MEDTEVIELAAKVIGMITSDLSNGIYKKLGGNLVHRWSTDSRVSAWAVSESGHDEPPLHYIYMTYDLVLRFYRDAESYHEFVYTQISDQKVGSLFINFDPRIWLSVESERSHSISNMFISAMTWVFFHELGHLVQEHGYIRSSYEPEELTSLIEDCNSSGTGELNGRAASISHATEFAADVEATHWCVMELARHFLPSVLNSTTAQKKEFQNNLHHLVCGISNAIYLFYGEANGEPEELPIGSHPTPLRRLEVCLPNIFEKLDFNKLGSDWHGMKRDDLVHMCIGAAYSVGFFWLWRRSTEPVISIPDNFMPKGILQDPFLLTYWTDIISIWDELLPEIMRIRRFGGALGILDFSDELRSKIKEIE